MDSPSTQADRLAAVAALGEPLRRKIYLFVASEAEAVSRDRAAETFGVSRAVAAFHLDKLADLGLLDVEFRRMSGRGGPGAGRPAKHYRPVRSEVSFSLPPREYELAGRLLAEAVTVSKRDGLTLEKALADAAGTVGRSMGRRVREVARQPSGPDQSLDAVCRVLEEYAYQPQRNGTDVALLNCPFHSLAQQYRDLVCGMNLALMSGLTAEIQEARMTAQLDPRPRQCCVRLTDGKAQPGR